MSDGVVITRSEHRLGGGHSSAGPALKPSQKPANGKNGSSLLVEGIQIDSIPVSARASKIPDNAFIENCYSRIQDCKTSCEGDRAQLRNDVTELLEGMAKTPGSYSAMVTSLLMKHWVQKREDGKIAYDEHMKGHVEAIGTLFKAWNKDRYQNLQKIKVLDVSCGTGKSLEAFLRSLPEEMYGKVHVLANDVSKAAIDAARENLRAFEGRVKIEFENKDITREMPRGRFDVVILSQTMPFIVDDKTLRNRRLNINIRRDEDLHIKAKRQLVEKLIRFKVRQDGGEMLVVDEEPMQLSKTPDDLDGLVEDVLFNEVFRDIREQELINEMKLVKAARFDGHLKTPIDREHDMYLFAYGRNRVSVASDPKEDEEKIIRAMENAHPTLIKRLGEFEKDKNTTYKSISPADGGQRLTINPDLYAEKIQNKALYWSKNGSNNLVIINGLVHQLGVDEYRRIIENLKRSKKAEPGAALLFIDQWPSPESGVGNSKARSMMNSYNDHLFAAAFRSGRTYGYLYLIRNI